jgi:alpha-galactosidase
MGRKAFFAALICLLFLPADFQAQPSHRLQGRNIHLEFDDSLHSRVVARFGGKDVAFGPFSASEYVSVAGADVKDFKLAGTDTRPVRDAFGPGRRLVLTGSAASLKKTVAATSYDEFPRTVFLEVRYTNTGSSDLQITGWTSHHYTINSYGAPSPGAQFWSYQSGSYRDRRDWVQPLTVSFSQENFLGMNADEYGGGTPVADIWRKDGGIGIGHVELAPRLVSLPVTMPDDGSATLAVSFKSSRTLKPGETTATFRTFATVHQGDYFQTLADYRRIMEKQGVRFHSAPESAFGPIWCAWGYGKTCTPDQIYGALPVVKKLGFNWVQTDWGW